MDSEYLVKLALQILDCSQKDLATKLNVSTAQITKWKKGEYMSDDMESKIRSLTAIGEHDPLVIFMSGSVEAAEKWEKLIDFLADFTLEEAETGYNTIPLIDERPFLYWHVFYCFKALGIDIPKSFPEEIDFGYKDVYHEDISDEESERLMQIVFHENAYSSVIHSAFMALNDLYGFYAAYIDELIYSEDLDLFDTDAVNIETSLLELSFCKINLEQNFSPNFKDFKYETLKNYNKWLTTVKTKAFKSGIPLKAELLSLVLNDHDEVGHAAEAESFGFNSRNLHPDIYMNEILCSLRTIHQILPVIMKKLGVYEEFKLDESEFYIK